MATNSYYAPGWSNTLRFASIYAGGERIAQGMEGNVVFEFGEPFTGRRRGVEPDPLDQPVGTFDPGPDEAVDQGGYPEPHEFGNVEDLNLGCTADGITIDCNTAMTLLHFGAAGLAPQNGNRPVADPNHPGQRILVPNAPIFGDFLLGAFWEWIDTSGKKPTGQPVDDPNGDVIHINGWIPSGHYGSVYYLAWQGAAGNVQRPQKSSSPCTFNINITNRSGVPLTKNDLAAIEKNLNAIFESGGFRATVNNPNAATDPDFNYNLTIYKNFPSSYPRDVRFDNTTVGYTRLTRQIPDSPYPNIYFPGPTGGISVDHIRASYGAKYTRMPALGPLISAIGAHEMIAHYLLDEPGHPDQYAEGITAEAIGPPDNTNRVISPAVKEQLEKICKSGELPK